MRQNWLGPLTVCAVISIAVGCTSTNDRKGQSGPVSKSARTQRPEAATITEKRAPVSGGPVLRSPDPDQATLFSPPPTIASERVPASKGTSGQGLLLLAAPPTAPSSDIRMPAPATPSQPALKGGDDTGWTRTTSLAKAANDVPVAESPPAPSSRDGRVSWAGPAPQQVSLRETPPPVRSNSRATPSAPGPRTGTAMDHAADYSWIQGRLEYSVVAGGVWKVRYAPPSADDEHGGSVVLDSDPSTQGCQAGDTVYVNGQVAAGPQRNPLSNPSYRVQRIVRVE